MPEIAAAQTAADMTYAKPHAFMPTGGSNRRAARMQAAALRWLVRMAALLTAAVLVFLIGYILVMGIPNLKPELFAWEYNSENVSLTPALINTVLMTAFSLAISTPLGIFAAIWLVEYAHRGSKLVKAVRVTTETLQGIPDGTQDGLALRGIVILYDLRSSFIVTAVLALCPHDVHCPAGALCGSTESRAYKDIHDFQFIFQNQHLLLPDGLFRSVHLSLINV